MSILKRTVYYDLKDGRAMFWDWAKVTTTLSVMCEPFIPGLRHDMNQDFEDFDPEDEINRIDDIRAMPIDKEQVILSDNHVMGGATVPRANR